MNWLDVSIIFLVFGGALLGMRLGLVRATFTGLGIIIGLLLFGQINDDVAAYYAEYISNETLIALLGYVVVIVVSGVLALLCAAVVGKYAYTLLFGWPDRVAGLAMGLIGSLAISAAVIIAVADLASSPEVPGDSAQDTLLDHALEATEAREMLAETLTQSAIVPTFSGLIDSFPVPARFPEF